METFEQFLMSVCPTHTNNSPEGFEKWLEELDGEEYMNHAEKFGKIMYLAGKIDALEEAKIVLREVFNK